MNKKIVLTVFLFMYFLSATPLTRFVVTVRAGSGYTNVSVSEAKEMIDSNAELVILDVRNMWEYESGHIRNAILIPLGELEGRLDELDNEKETLVHCQSGGRSASASEILALNGFTKVYNMLGGFSAWRNAGYPIETVFYILWVYSSPTGVTFTVDGVSPTAPWLRTYDEGVLVSLEMPEIHTVGAAKYCWDQWSDGNASRSRTVTMNTDVTLTAYYSGPYHQLTVTSSPITGVTFTIGGVPQTTSYSEWLLEGSYILEMPETYDGYVWSHWLGDGDTNRIKTVTVDTNITLTGVFTPVLPPPPVGGKAIPIIKPVNNLELQIPWIWLTTILFPLIATLIYVKKRKER